ncbi:hypothetical protein EZV62_026016 [Acer yangbiense]|uniref:Uncharacterized protein n=1 Tax=Acer yangbiense TaxID=1000413 RepID=A0A5C7H012_9ROSI|nr:hypothetical protein EZV62_026016 [Acer yangbiense]
MTKSVEKVGVFHRNFLPVSSPVLLTLITICEKAVICGQPKKFYDEADKNYWKAIAELLPNEVPTIEKKKGKKDQEKKPSIVVIQGPKPCKPTDLSRMQQAAVVATPTEVVAAACQFHCGLLCCHLEVERYIGVLLYFL